MQIQTKELLIEVVQKIAKEERVAVDTESTGLDERNDTLLIISLYTPSVGSYSIVLDNPQFNFNGVPIEFVQEQLASLLGLTWIFHNSKYDILVLGNNGIQIPKKFEDSILAIHIADPDTVKNLEERVKIDFGFSKKKFSDICGLKWDRINWRKDTLPGGKVKLSDLCDYADSDVEYTYKLFEFWWNKISADKAWLDLYEKIEKPLVNTLVAMKMKGVLIDVPLLTTMEKDVDKAITDIEAEVYEEAGCIFNIGSSKQLGDVLFNKLCYPVYYTTPKGSPSTDKGTMEHLAASGYPLAKLLQEHSMLSTLQTSFVKKIPTLVDSDNRLRCNFNSVGTRTGRLSSSDPNLQNQPNNKKYPVRRAFIPAHGNSFIVADWSQIELRILAHVSDDKRLIEAFTLDEDVHQYVADLMGVERRDAKAINFGLIYGMGPDKLAANLGCSIERAKELMATYLNTLVGFKQWKSNIENFATKNRRVTNLFGRVRWLPDANSSNKSKRSSDLRRAVNTVIQGTCADMMKLAMVRIHQNNVLNQWGSNLLLSVHDEVVIEVPDTHVEKAYDVVKGIMENILPLKIPIKADVKICANWDEMKGAVKKIAPIETDLTSFIFI